MRSKIILVICLFSFSGKGQTLFNQKIEGLNVEFECDGSGWDASRKTITHDQQNNIVFLSNNEAQSPAYSGFELQKLNSAGSFVSSAKISVGANNYVFPTAIISTMDNGFIVIGNCAGSMLTGFPASSYSLFYAKFTNSFALVTFRIHKGFPFSSVPPGGTMATTGYSIAARPNGVNEDYYIIGTTEEHSSHLFNAIKLDYGLSPVKETHSNVSNQYGGVFMPRAIDYMVNKGVFAITGAVYISLPGVTYPPGTSGYYPGIITMDNNLNFITRLAVVQVAPAPFQSLRYYPTNAVEDHEGNLLWAFPMFLNPLRTMVLKQDVNNLNLLDSRELVLLDCTGDQIVQEIRNTGDSHDQRFALGVTDFYCGLPYSIDNVKPALITMNDDFNTIYTYRTYSEFDYTGWDPSAPGFYQNNHCRLKSFMSMTDHEPGYVLHVADFADAAWVTAAQTRIVSTDVYGESWCTTVKSATTDDPDAVAYLFGPSPVQQQSKFIYFSPTVTPLTYTPYPCAPNKPGVASVSGEPGLNDYKIYPNPAQGGLLYITGSIKDNTVISFENVCGQTILKKTVNACDKLALPIGDLAKGMYILKISCDGKPGRTEKLIVE